MLSHLLPELCEEIISHCDCSSLKNLACTNTEFYHATKQVLWYAVKIPLSHLARNDFAANKKKLSNLKRTRIISFDDDYGYSNRAGKKTKKKIRTHYKILLDYCDPRIVHTFSIKPNMLGDLCIPLACHTFNRIEKLGIPFGEISEDGYRAIGKLNYLLELDLNHAYILDSDLPVLFENLNKLKILNLRNTDVGPNNGFVTIHKLASLEELILSGCEVYDDSLKSVGTLPLLKKIHLKRCCKITDVGLAHLSHLPMLEELSIRYAAVTDTGMYHLRNLITLKILDVSKCYDIDNEKGVTDLGISYINNLTLLTELNVTHSTNITNVGLSYLSSLTLLKKLSVSFNKAINNDGIPHLRHLKNLEELELRGTKITDLAVAHVCSFLPSLKMLDICRTNITGIGIKYLLSVTSISTVKYPNSEWEDVIHNSDESEDESWFWD